MLENTVDLSGLDIVWRDKPLLPAANEENKKLEEMLKQKKIETEKLKIVLENNINKGKNIKEHFKDLCDTLSYKQQLYKSREHELEMEIHAEKVIERECSRLEQEMKAINHDVDSLKARQQRREMAISEQEEKKKRLKSAVQWDEETLLRHLEKSAQMEKDNIALLKYTSEDHSKINELGLSIERLSKEAYEKKSALGDANTEVLIVQTELDRIQEEFHNAYVDRNNLISNWEKVINQIQQRNKEINKLSESILKLQAGEADLKHTLKEYTELMLIESRRNNEFERKITDKDNLAAKLRNESKAAVGREEDLKTQLSTVRNVLSNALYQKELAENSLKQFEKHLSHKIEKLEDVKNSCRNIENNIETLSKETFEADHYTKEVENLLRIETDRNIEMQKEVSNLAKDILTYGHEMNELKMKEKVTETRLKNCQAENRNLNNKIIALDQVRTKQESDMYEIESRLEKLRRRVKKMSGETNEEERRKIEKERSSLLASLEDIKNPLNMITEELKLMMDKINISRKQLEYNKKVNLELAEKIKFLDFYISNSQKSLKCCISRKQEFLVQECLDRFQMKKYKKLLSNKNKSVASLQKSKLEFEMMMKERVEELKHCNDVLEAEIRSEEEECCMVKKKYHECNNKVIKLQSKYKVILDALGVSEPGGNAEAEMLIKAEDEKRDLQYERDKLILEHLKSEDELTALRNTVWLINATNEQFKQVLNPPGINSEDSELLKSIEVDVQVLAIRMHAKKTELKTVEDSVKVKKEKLEHEQNFCSELQDVIKDRELETESVSKELTDLQTKMQRADKSNFRLNLELRNKSIVIPGIEEDIRIHLLREVRRTVSDLLFSATESVPEASMKVEELYQQAHLPLPSRARSSLALRRSSLSSFHSRASVSLTSPSSSGRSSRSGLFSPSVVSLGSIDVG